MENEWTCPNVDCQASWGIEECSFQECSVCGYPHHERDEEIDYDNEEL